MYINIIARTKFGEKKTIKADRRQLLVLRLTAPLVQAPTRRRQNKKKQGDAFKEVKTTDSVHTSSTCMHIYIQLTYLQLQPPSSFLTL